MTPAQRWGAALLVEMDGIRCVDLAEAVGVVESHVVRWRSGLTLPSLESAQAVANALGAPSLAELCVELRTMRCEACTRDFVSNNKGGRPRRFCGKDCQSSWHNRRNTTDRRDGSKMLVSIAEADVTFWRTRAESAISAITAFCRACEWDGICKDATCPIQVSGESPFPLATERVA